MREERPELRAVLASGFIEDPQLPDGVEFLPKPFGVESLDRAVRRALEEARA